MFGLSALWVRLIGFGLLAAAIAGGAWYLHHRWYYEGYHARDATITALRDTQSNQLATIETLKKDNQAWADKYETDLQATKAVADAAISHADALQKRTQELTQQLHDLYKNNKAAGKWSSERVPAGVAERLHAARSGH